MKLNQKAIFFLILSIPVFLICFYDIMLCFYILFKKQDENNKQFFSSYCKRLDDNTMYKLMVLYEAIIYLFVEYFIK